MCVCAYLDIANRFFPGKIWLHLQTYYTHERPQSEQMSRFVYLRQSVS